MPIAHPLADLVARATGAPAAAVRVAPRAPLEHQSNRLYDVFVPDRHLIAKEFVRPDERATAPLREHRALELLADLDAINTMPANQRLRRYLARALAWPAEDFADRYEALGKLDFFPIA